jgi:outer membrane protein assembly factor BamB
MRNPPAALLERQRNLFVTHVRFVGGFVFSFCTILIAVPFARGDHWPTWRGPAGDGHCRESGVPVRWDAKSVLWKTALPGMGQSSPILWGERIFLTAALEQGKQRLVLCLDRRTGAILWKQEAWSGEPEPSHKMNGWATASCVTDGERVIAFFGKGGLHCYSLEGKPLWSRDLGAFPGPWGTSACPVIVGDLVIQNCDAMDEASLVALDKRTGKTVWQTPRTPPLRGGWSTPILVQTGKRPELVLNGEKAVTSYDPSSGKELWSCKSFNGRGEPTVTPGNGLLFVVNGLAGDIYAVRPGGSGDVTATHMAWHTPRKGGRDQPSPILIGNHLFVAEMKGLVTCYDSASGKVLWKDRLRGEFTAAPIAAGGLAYFQNEAGETFVLAPGTSLNVVTENTMGAGASEIFRASLAVSNGHIFARSHQILYCIGKKQGE